MSSSEFHPDVVFSHPRFAEARRALIDGYLRVYSGEPALNKLLVDVARHVIITFVLCLDAAQREDEPVTWLTLARLQDTVATHQVGSPGLVEAIVTRMLDRGLLTTTVAPGDRRKRILRPTEAMLEHDRDLLAAQAAPCAMIAPKPAHDLALARDPVFQRYARLTSVTLFGEAMTLLGGHPRMMLFVARDSGYMVLLSLLASALDAPDGRARVLYQDIADRFGISRTHVRELVGDAERAGLLSVQRAGGAEIAIEPALWQCFDRWLADTWGLFDRTTSNAWERMQADRAAAGTSRPG